MKLNMGTDYDVKLTAAFHFKNRRIKKKVLLFFSIFEREKIYFSLIDFYTNSRPHIPLIRLTVSLCSGRFFTLCTTHC